MTNKQKLGDLLFAGQLKTAVYEYGSEAMILRFETNEQMNREGTITGETYRVERNRITQSLLSSNISRTTRFSSERNECLEKMYQYHVNGDSTSLDDVVSLIKEINEYNKKYLLDSTFDADGKIQSDLKLKIEAF